MVELNAFNWLNKNQLSYDIWDKKYRFNQESFDSWLDRVSGGDEYIKRLIYEKKFLFGGRTLANRQTGQGSLNNCYSSGYVEDNLEDIMQVNKNIALTFKAQGGQGLSLSKIRPKGSLINNTFKTEGIIPAIESSHAVAYAMKLAPTLNKDQVIVVTLSGRGDIDCAAIARYRGENLYE